MDTKSVIRTAIVGFGYWGPNLVRNFSLIDEVEVAYICDLDEQRLARAKRQYPSVRFTSSIDEVLGDPSVDLVAIATPVASHFALAMRVLQAKKHILVEKPLAFGSELAERVLATAAQVERMVFVDHTFVFTPAVQKMRAVFDSGDLGNLLYYDSVRINLGIFRHDVNVVWDLATHDLAILDFVLRGQMPRSVCCTGVAHFGGEIADLAHLTLKYDNDFIAHIHVNWLAPAKVRQVLLCGDKQMLVYDDNSASEKIKIYNSGVEVSKVEDIYNALVQYRTGDMLAPKLDSGEALLFEARNIVETLRGRTSPVCDGLAGLRVLRVLEAADQSRRLGGAPVAMPREQEPVKSYVDDPTRIIDADTVRKKVTR